MHLLLDYAYYLLFFHYFLHWGINTVPVAKYVSAQNKQKAFLNQWSIYFFWRHFNPINGKLYYLLWKQTWKKYLKHAVNYDTKWNIIFMLSLCSWNNFSFTVSHPLIEVLKLMMRELAGISAIEASFYR